MYGVISFSLRSQNHTMNFNREKKKNVAKWVAYTLSLSQSQSMCVQIVLTKCQLMELTDSLN